jgi:hypothetical protein
MKTINKALTGIGILTGIYLLVSNASGAGRLLSTGFKGGSDFVATLQARR